MKGNTVVRLEFIFPGINGELKQLTFLRLRTSGRLRLFWIEQKANIKQ